MFTPLNQYHVVMEVDPRFQYGPEALKDIYLHSADRPAGAAEHAGHTASITAAPIVVNHQGLFPSVTISFNLKPGVALGDAVTAIQQIEKDTGKPASLVDVVPGQCAGLPVVAVRHAAADRGGADRDLHHPRRAL